MGIVFLPFSENAEVLIRDQAYEKHFLDDCMIVSNKRVCFADLLAEVFEKQYLVAETFVSGSAICPSDVLHAAASAFRADMDI